MAEPYSYEAVDEPADLSTQESAPQSNIVAPDQLAPKIRSRVGRYACCLIFLFIFLISIQGLGLLGSILFFTMHTLDFTKMHTSPFLF